MASSAMSGEICSRTDRTLSHGSEPVRCRCSSICSSNGTKRSARHVARGGRAGVAGVAGGVRFRWRGQTVQFAFSHATGLRVGDTPYLGEVVAELIDESQRPCVGCIGIKVAVHGGNPFGLL